MNTTLTQGNQHFGGSEKKRLHELQLMDLLLWLLLLWDTPSVKSSRLQVAWKLVTHALRKYPSQEEFQHLREKARPSYLLGVAILSLEAIGFIKHEGLPSLISLDVAPHMKGPLIESAPEMVRKVGTIAISLAQEAITPRQALQKIRSLSQSQATIPA